MLLTFLALAVSPLTAMPVETPDDGNTPPKVAVSAPAKEQPKIDCAKAARDIAGHGSKPRRSRMPTFEEAYDCSPNELYPETRQRLTLPARDSRHPTPSVDELVMQGIIGKEGIQIAPADSRPAGEQSASLGVSAATYGAAQKADGDADAGFVTAPMAPLSPLTTGIIGTAFC